MKSALCGLALRFVDGGELRVRPGSEARGPREVSYVDASGVWLLARNGRPCALRPKLERMTGLVYYVGGGGDEVWTAVAFGGLAYLRPFALRGRRAEPRLVFLGDLWRLAAADLRDHSPKRSAQYPLAHKHATFLARICAELFPAAKARVRSLRIAAGLGVELALTTELRVEVGGAERVALRTSLHLAPDAAASLETVAGARGGRLYRVLPEGRQTRSRYLGGGVPLAKRFEEVLPWKLPLAHPAQRRAARRHLAPYVESRESVVEVRARR